MESLAIDELGEANLRVKLLKKTDKTIGEAGAWMDMERKKLQAYEYLCHVAEAKEWIEAVIKEITPSIEELEESIRNGVIFAKLAKSFDESLNSKRIFEASKLQFKHSDNINMLFQAMHHLSFPEVFIFELTDLYDKKNIPKVIYCIHALSHWLANKGLTPQIKNLVGELSFTDEQLHKTNESLEAAAVPMPAFSNVQKAIAKECDEPSEQEKRMSYLKSNENRIIGIQAFWRGCLDRKTYNERMNTLKSHEELWSKLQARYKGMKDRSKYLEKLNRWKCSQDSIVKIQALWRAKQAEKAYKSLCSSKDSNMKILQNFLFLLEEGDYDFEEDIELDLLKKLVVIRIRENIDSEEDVNQLDLKIALLIKNRISLEEVVHFTTKKMKSIISSNEEITGKDSLKFNLKGTDRENRQRKLHYEQLFYLLQTQPHYLTKLMNLMNQKSGASVTRFLEQTVLTLFGYAQNNREEYLLLNLIDSAIKLEVSFLTRLEDFWKDNPLFIKLVLQYIRGAKERLFLRELLQPIIKVVLKNKNLDLDLDPVTIYKKLIKQEESNSGIKSSKPHEITPFQAASDPDVQKTQIENLKNLKQNTDCFLNAIIGSINKMPFGIRHIAMKMKEHLLKKFPESEIEINKIVGNLIYYRYINPAVVAPEAFDVMESTISSSQRKNLAEIAKTLHLISTSKVITATEPHLVELNHYVQNSSKKFCDFLNEVKTSISPEEFFDMNEFLISSTQSKPKIYISPEEIYEVHRSLDEYKNELVSRATDEPLNIILNDLGPIPPSGYGIKQTGSEIILDLKDRFAKIDDENEIKLKKLIKETKRLVVALIHVQTGPTLLEALEAPVTAKEEAAFTNYLENELARANERASALEDATSPSILNLKGLNLEDPTTNIESPFSMQSLHIGNSIQTVFQNNEYTRMSFGQLKCKILENMYLLEKSGEATKDNKYQDMINSLTEDVLNKHRRRNRRKKDIDSLTNTLKTLDEKSIYLNDQKKFYHDYINSCMSQLGKKVKAKRIIPFSRQYYHLRDLNKQGKTHQLGSFKYSANELLKKGVLISIDDYDPKQYNQISLIISSDEPGIFIIEATFLGVKFPEKMELRLEDLLTAQDNNESVVTLFESARVNLNLLIFLLNKK